MSKTDAQEMIAVRFIKDEPSETDFFGSHSRVATAISEVIGEDNGINIVGLLGSWGSGKSTVVSQIKRQLGATRENIHFFSYDAWLYQNDPPRRSFLEALIQDLVQNALSDDAQWQDRLADLSGRSEETVTETSRRLSLTGKWIIGSLGLVPVGTVVLGRALDPKIIKDAPWMMVVGFALTIAPVIMATLFYLSWRPWRQSWLRGYFKSEFWTRHREPYAKQSIFALLTNQSVERAEKKTKINPEPSVTEFRNVFRDVLRSLRVKRERLVIVIDNLDRLAESEAIELWATIRSLFLGNELNSSQRSELTLPTIILPIDEGSVQRMFRASGNSDEADQLARSFMDKTFDVSFYINAPVMSDWREFFREKLRQAFGNAATDERVYWATKFVEEHALAKSTSRNITPRSLVKLVNAVGVLVKQWGDGSIEFLSMVFFVLHRPQISADPVAFVNDSWPNVATAVADWQRDIVALHYGVPRDKAFQALLQEPLRLAILAKDESEFSRLSEVVGFGPVFEDVVTNPPAGANGPGPDPNFASNAALLISISDARDELWAKRGMQKLARIWCECGKFDSFRPDFAGVIKAITPFSTGLPFIEVSASQLSASLPKSVMSDDLAKNFAAALKALSQAAMKNSQKFPLVQLSLDTSDLFTIIKYVPSNLLSILRSDKSATELVTALGACLGNEAESDGVAHTVQVLMSTETIQLKDKTKPNLDSIADLAFVMISGNVLSFHATGPSVDVLGILYSKNRNAKVHVEQLFDQGHLANRLNEADQAKNSPRLGAVAALMFLRGSDFSAPNGKTWERITAEDAKFIQNFDSALAWYHAENRAMFAHLAMQSLVKFRPIIIEVIKLDINENNTSEMTTDHLLNNIVSISDLVGSKLASKALADVVGRPDFWSTLYGLKNGRPYDEAVTALSDVSAVDRGKLIESVKTRLIAFEASAWTEALSDNVAPYNLAEIFSDTFGQSDVLGDGLRTALTDSLPQLAQASEGARKRWFFLSRFVSRDARVTLFKNLRDKIQSGTDFAELAVLMSVGGSQFLGEGKFEEFGDKTSRHVIIPLLPTEIGLVYVSENLDVFARCISASDDETKSAIQEALRSASDLLGDVEQSALEKVTSALLVAAERLD